MLLRRAQAARHCPRLVTGTERAWIFRPRRICAVVVVNAQTEENVTGMAEATVLFILGALYDFNGTQELLREIVAAADPLRAHQLRGKTVGFVAASARSARRPRGAARRLRAPPMQYTARRDAELTRLPAMKRVDLDTLLKTGDVVVVLAALNAETRGMISADKLELMKRSAILVNTARGQIIDEKALYEALQERRYRRGGARLLRG